MKTVIFALMLSLLTYKAFASSFSESAIKPWGSDVELTLIKKEDSENKNLRVSLNVGQKSCRKMIRFFQVYISPIDGPRSSFYPTSSQYALEAIQKYGVFRGIAMGCDRLMRENGEMWIYETTNRYGIERKLDPVR